MHIILYAFFAICVIVVSVVSHEKISDLRFSNTQKDNHIKHLYKDIDFWRDRCLSKSCDGDKIKLYEKILGKMLGDREPVSDSIFLFESKCYRPVSISLNHNMGEVDTLTVEFVATGIPNMSKGETK